MWASVGGEIFKDFFWSAVFSETLFVLEKHASSLVYADKGAAGVSGGGGIREEGGRWGSNEGECSDGDDLIPFGTVVRRCMVQSNFIRQSVSVCLES